MNAKLPDETGVEDLLRRALVDDLPPKVAAGMRSRLDGFRKRARAREGRPGISIFLFPRRAWAVLSTLMFISGGLLQGLGSRTPLTDRLSTMGIFQTVARRLTTADSMACRVRFPRDDGSLLSYDIAWRTGHESRVTVTAPDSALPGTLEEAGQGPIDRERLRAVAPLLTPSDVASLLSGEWQLAGFSRENGCDLGTFRSTILTGRMALEFTVDMCTYLPVQINGYENGRPEAGGTAKAMWEARLVF